MNKRMPTDRLNEIYYNLLEERTEKNEQTNERAKHEWTNNEKEIMKMKM